jgi:shikimate kinase
MRLTDHLYLTGYRGTGKSSVARLLADRFGVPVIDLDAVIEQEVGKSIAEIFQQSGETGFREVESSILDAVAQSAPAVISLGGGTVLRPENRERIAQTGTCVWLDADAETIADRLAADQTTAQRRPALTSLPSLDEIRYLLDQRRPIYEQASQHRIDTAGRSVEQIVDEIIAWLTEFRP